jgi:ADP-ribose pyrophosphatase YjhB (NUDIX family)
MVALYQLLKQGVGIFFNILNQLMGGNLPPFACAGVVVEEQGRLLVMKQPDGNYSFPGGFMRWQEHPEQTAQRECYEETGLTISTGTVIGSYIITSHQFHRMSTLTTIYRGKVTGGHLRTSLEGEPCWLSANELRDHLTPMHENVLADYLSRDVHSEIPVKQSR